MTEPAFDPLLVELRDVARRADPVPPAVVAGARAAFAWRTIDAELAELTADSLLADAGVRAGQAARLLTFEGPGVEVEVEVAEVGARRRLTGQVVPPERVAVTARWNGGSTSATTDELGQFAIADVPAGLLRLEVQPATAPLVVTSWVAV